MSNILATAIRNIPHLVAFDEMAKKKIDALELEKLLVYIVDTVDKTVLPFLAEQFDVLGYKGMKLATTEEQQREVIKKAIELKRYKGTVWAVKEALRTIGYPTAIITEGVGSGPNGWAEFKILLDGGNNFISASSIDDILKNVEEYKNTRSHLVGVSFSIDLGTENINLTDESVENPSVIDEDVLTVGSGFRYDGANVYDGSKNYSSDSDILEMEIITT
ncbi:phage tail protein I [Pedobacter sp. Hv1]|uniref:phage tail protein I n=1 Tax=Pedobacter sp. Hv1 TaxID=1740090 RepID=UPI0006D8A3CE|nr:phage tail protein I [Pedobacter sp. Hv1]KQC02106.1 hypothetical protein AQF98_00595 [Pedobacter sp. Hv1]